MTHKRTITFYFQAFTIALTTILFGFMAGFFWTYTFNVNVAMLEVDGETYTRMQALFNQNVRHLPFFSLFFGSVFAAAAAILANLKHYRRGFFWLFIAAAAVYLGGIIFYTQSFHLPINADLESWDLSNIPVDWRTARDAWNYGNQWRVAASATAFILGMAALFGRATAQD